MYNFALIPPENLFTLKAFKMHSVFDHSLSPLVSFLKKYPHTFQFHLKRGKYL